ncbi:MAG: amidohydrolase [Ilumatobacteraceae bacterium]|nr:amidohydrolase [Ilumatobacteraceae bacterium]
MPGTTGPEIIDVHAHCMPDAVHQLLMSRFGVNAMMKPLFVPDASPVSDVDDEIASRLAMMDQAGVSVQVLSLPPMPMVGGEVDAVDIARFANDAHSRMAAAHPHRFRSLVQLPLPYLEPSLIELNRGLDQLHMDGVMVFASYGPVSVMSEQFDPLLTELNRRKAVVLLHPTVGGLCSPLLTDFQLNAPLGPALEDTVVVFQMLKRQFFTRFPDIRIIIPHLGGMLPIYLQRMDNQMSRAVPDLPDRPSALMRRLWFDTMSHGSLVGLRAAHQAFGADRLLAGSDYPAMEHFDGYAASLRYVLDAGFSQDDLQRIMHDNAAELFGIAD